MKKFKLLSVKVKEMETGDEIQVVVESESGTKITATLKPEKLPAFETLEIDVNREVKHELREQLRQLEIKDETERG